MQKKKQKNYVSQGGGEEGEEVEIEDEPPK